MSRLDTTSAGKSSGDGQSDPIPAIRFKPFFNAATSEWIEYTTTGQDSDGEVVRFNWRSVPGGEITEHFHPHQEERFTINAGIAHFTLNDTPNATPDRTRSTASSSFARRSTPKRCMRHSPGS